MMIAALALVAVLAASPTGEVTAACPCATAGGPGGSCTRIDGDELEALFSSDTSAFVARIERYDATMSDCEKRGSAELNYYAGLSHMLRNNHREAEQAFRRTLALEPSLALEYRTLASLANLYFLEGDYANAFAHGVKLSDLRYAGIDADGRARGKIVIANALVDAGLYDEAEVTLDSFDTAQLAPRLACVAHYVQIQLRYKRGDVGVALAPLRRNIEWCQEHGQTLYALLSLQGLSRIMTNAGEIDAARQILATHQAQVRAFGYDNLLALWLSAQAQNELLEGNLERSIETGEEALAVENAARLMEVQLTAHQVLARAHQLAGNLEVALRHHQAYHEAYARAHDRQLASATAYQAVVMQEAQRNQDVELLRLENRLAHAEAENARLYLVIAGVALLLVSILAHRALKAQRKLRQRVRYDNLTGALSRDHFYEQLKRAVARAEKRGADLGLILFDLDRFKRINDEYGHPVGDWALREVAVVAGQVVGTTDGIGRLGGEEFGIVLRGASLSHVRDVAEQIRRAFEAIDTTTIRHELRITASFGCTTASRSGYSVEDMVADADKALYRSKQSGRNCVSVPVPGGSLSIGSGDSSLTQSG